MRLSDEGRCDTLRDTAEPEMGSFILSSTATLPNHIVDFVQRRCPNFRLTFSKTVRAKYYANNCPKCGVIAVDYEFLGLASGVCPKILKLCFCLVHGVFLQWSKVAVRNECSEQYQGLQRFLTRMVD